ncbi:MAG: hypothetical protein IPJ28_22705 [Betaproteobacteria bacterium]|nr:hypothetical protein [Betaproteobacteria bacterium]
MPTSSMPVPAPVVTFVLGHLERDWPDIERLTESEIERQPSRFQGGRNSWIAQGYLRLREGLERLGCRVRVASRVPSAGIALVHRDDANDCRVERSGAFVVVVRADRAPVLACDLAIAQNGTRLRRGERFLPLWPQPGLRPRDAQRGHRIARLTYHGRPDRLPAWLAEPRFLADLSARGIRFESLANGWGDYRSTDLVLAVRADSPAMLATKPATKVYNAWLAGVPVLATAEPAYLEVRGSPLDFMEIASPEDVLAAIDRLKASPGLYRSMIANGLAHAREFDIEAIRGRWLDLFDREILPMHARGHVRPGPARRAWYVGAMAAQKVLGRAFKARVGFERWRLFSPWTPLRLIEATGRSLAWGWKPPLPEAGNGPESTMR